MDDASDRTTAQVRVIPPRVLPVPSTVSEALRQSIAASYKLPADRQARAPSNSAEWKASAEASDALNRDRLAAIRVLFPCEIAAATLGGVTVREITPATLDPAKASRRLVHLHGGGYLTGAGEAGLPEGVLGAHYTRTRVISVDYRMPPDHPFPAAVDDAVAVWQALVAVRPPRTIGVYGTSAGGGLALAMTLRLKAMGLPLPAILGLGTPWADLTGQSDSYATNHRVDGVLTQYEGYAEGMAKLYAGAANLADPLISPVQGDLSGFPPAILTTGTRDILLSDTVRVYRKLRAAGVEARLELHEAMSHAEYNFAFRTPESAVVFSDLSAFFDRHLSD